MKRRKFQSKFEHFREEYPFFTYQSYSFNRIGKGLVVEFHFSLADRSEFHPKMEFHSSKGVSYSQLSDDEINSFVFHMGMVELISYWKLACPPMVYIKAQALSARQMDWWRKLYFHGLGEFFYLNGIETDMHQFMEIHSEGDSLKLNSNSLNNGKVLVPIGGGKDSVVSLELLKDKGFQILPFILNPREASVRTIESAGFHMNDALVVNRSLDPLMLDLNTRGFLNGHTPFSSLLAFVSVFAAYASGSMYVALSNENSANESTVPGTKINHQYSKSFEFEHDFNEYLKEYLHPELHYFSLLRPLSELQIAALFSKYPWHFNGFRSCNVGSKTDSWCCNCPKCLFTYIILSPFVEKQVLLAIFGEDLVQKPELKLFMDELRGVKEVKPFECVGTPKEVNLSLWKYGHESVASDQMLAAFEEAMNACNDEHLLPERFETIIKNAQNG